MHGLSIREHTIVGAICVVLTLALLAVGLRAVTGAFDPGYELQASFPQIGQGLDTFSDVRIRGVRVGTVEDIAVDEHGRPLVTIRMQPDVRVPRTARASVEPLSIFGPTYIALDPGEAEGTGPYLEPDETIAASGRTAELQDLLERTSQLLAGIDPDELGAVLRSSATIAADLAPRAGPMVDASTRLSGVAARHTDRGTRLLADLDRISTELEGVGPTLSSIAQDAGSLLPALVDAEDDLSATLGAAVRSAQVVSEVLERHPDAISQLAQGLLPAVLPPLAAVAGNVRVIPEFVEVIATFFAELAGVMHLDAPRGGRLGGIEMYLQPDPCEIFDLCPGGGP
jgi:phospholipid/cholesterol/gamma-HCH transport system substrate-binding protein